MEKERGSIISRSWLIQRQWRKEKREGVGGGGGESGCGGVGGVRGYSLLGVWCISKHGENKAVRNAKGGRRGKEG